MPNKQLFRVNANSNPGNGKPMMEQLVDKLNQASEAYYNGKEIMTNQEYDSLFDELKEAEHAEGRVLPNSPTLNVGAEVKGDLPKFKHTHPALSLDKTKSKDEFVSKFRKGVEASGSSNDKVVLMFKEDGSTLQAYYVDGILDKIVTRGDGHVGSIVTHNLSCISGLPAKLPFKATMVVRGETVMSYAEFNRINEQLAPDAQYANPRNLAAATLTMIDREEASKRHLKFQAFKLVSIDHYMIELDLDDYTTPHGKLIEDWTAARSSFKEQLDLLKSFGFNVVPYKYVSIDDLGKAMDQMTDEVEVYDYPVDGLVAALDNCEYTDTLPGTEHHPNILSGYAFKWADEAKETVLREIEWSPSRTGLLNPVAIFDPIELEGTTVSRASLHNLSIMRKMRIHVGDTLEVCKANMVIPMVLKNVDHDNEADYDDDFIRDLIGFCPTCGAAAKVSVSADGIETVYCPNEECPEKMIGNLVHFCSRDCMDIQGMSEETIKKLVELRIVAEYSDFFKLNNHPEIQQIPGFGEISWKNMCESANRSIHTDFVKFLTSLSIPNIGKGQVKLLLSYINSNYDSLCELTGMDSDEYSPITLLRLMSLFRFDFSAIDGFGSILSTDLSKWLHDHLDPGVDSPETRLLDIVKFVDVKPSTNMNSKVSGRSFCITGKLEKFANRQELVNKIESLGGKWVDSVSSKTDYLINNDITSTSGKNKKAKELNIPIITEADFLSMI